MYVAGINSTHPATIQNTIDNQKAEQNAQPKSLNIKHTILRCC